MGSYNNGRLLCLGMTSIFVSMVIMKERERVCTADPETAVLHNRTSQLIWRFLHGPCLFRQTKNKINHLVFIVGTNDEPHESV